MGSPCRSLDRARWASVALLAASCTVDAGATSADACKPSPAFFVSDVWPRYLVPNLCGISQCHAFDGGQGVLRFREVGAPPTGTLADWPLEWRENYLSSIQFLRCDDPAESRLLTMPEGIGNLHPPGPVVDDRATAKSVIESWLVAP
jgi:hypothetical protein